MMVGLVKSGAGVGAGVGPDGDCVEEGGDVGGDPGAGGAVGIGGMEGAEVSDEAYLSP